MRVLLASAVGGGGVDVWMESAREALARAGVDARLGMYPGACRFFPPLVSFWSPGRGGPEGPAPDIVHSSERMGFALARAGVPLVVTVHHLVEDPLMAACRTRAQAAFHRIETLYARLSIRRASAVVAVSEYTAGRVREIAGRADVRVVPNGVDTGFFSPGDAGPGEGTGTGAGAGADAAAAPGRVGARPFTVLFVGNLTLRKGADLLPRIAAKLGPGFEIRFTAGLRTRLPRSLAGAPGLLPLGRLDREAIRAQYRLSDVVLVPSRLEGFGLVAAEAMACGKPVVCSRASALPEVVADGEGGILVAPGDTAGFAAAIERLRDSPDDARRMGERNRERACRLFSLEAMGRSYAALYESLAGGPARAAGRAG